MRAMVGQEVSLLTVRQQYKTTGNTHTYTRTTTGMDKCWVVLVCLMTVSSAECLRRQHPRYNQPQPHNQPSYNIAGPHNQPYNIPGPFQHPSEPASRHVNGPFQEPANYDFRYDVDVPEYGTKFGHQEQRQGDVARGEYYVLLPDGRIQIVKYTADQYGYHPTISYQGGDSGYSRGGSGGGGYGLGGGFVQGGFRGNGHY